MASVSSAAKVDGVDLQVMVSAASAFVRPDTKVATPPDAEQPARISPAGMLKSATSAVLDSAARLNKAQTWSATLSTSSDESVVQVGGDAAKPGDYTVNVDAVAMAQTTSSATFSSLSTVIGIGTLNIEIGSWNGSQTAFATNPNWPKASVTIGPKDNSLERIKDKINAAGVGVIASVVTDATGSRLVLRATSTGAANGFKVTADPADKSGSEAARNLAALGFDPSALSGSTASSLTQAAQDAKLTVNDKPIQSATNLIEDKDTGLNLTLKSASDTPIKLRVESDPDAVQTNIQGFTQAYNTLQNQLSPPDAGISALSIEPALDIQRKVQQVFQASPDGASPLATQLGQIGIQMAPQGQLTVDNARLGQALREQPDQVEKLISGVNTRNPNESGLARQVLDTSAPPAPSADMVMGAEATRRYQNAIAPGPAEPTAAGALFRQKLLEQYAQGDDALATVQHDDELVIPANGA